MIQAVVGPLAFEFFVRALIAASIVGLVCAVVGSYMVLRGLAFMGDAVSHSAFPGVVAAAIRSATSGTGGTGGTGRALAGLRNLLSARVRRPADRPWPEA